MVARLTTGKVLPAWTAVSSQSPRQWIEVDYIGRETTTKHRRWFSPLLLTSEEPQRTGARAGDVPRLPQSVAEWLASRVTREPLIALLPSQSLNYGCFCRELKAGTCVGD